MSFFYTSGTPAVWRETIRQVRDALVILWRALAGLLTLRPLSLPPISISVGIDIGTIIAALAVGSADGAIGAEVFVFFEPYIDNSGIAFRFIAGAGVGKDLYAADLFSGQAI